ncbi:MAG: DUF898 domain-containing protein, partial [Xanthomonadales bacterium]|nr:DUF898 domain-containing protein [Xanthomonadales bacterium]
MKALSFSGTGGEYFKIWIVNILLVIITLGLYYPWAKVRNNRYFYANSVLEGRNFEYHATGKQLFVGYLIAMSLFIAFVLIQNISPIGSGVVLLIFFLAIPWIIWKSLKFNLRMSSFSNVRFSFAGVISEAYVNYLYLPIAFFIAIYAVPIGAVVLISLYSEALTPLISVFIGVAVVMFLVLAFYLFAYMKKRNTSYSVNGYRFGQGIFTTNLETAEFAKILGKTIGLWILAIVFLLVISGLVIGIDGFANFAEAMNESEATSENNQSFVGTLGLMYLGFIVASLLIMAYFYSRQREYIFANSSLDTDITLASTLQARSLGWVMISNFILIIFSLGLAIPWAKVRMARLILENTLVNTDVGFDQYVTQKQEEQSSLGEQIGDAFDVDVGIGI